MLLVNYSPDATSLVPPVNEHDLEHRAPGQTFSVVRLCKEKVDPLLSNILALQALDVGL